MFLSFQNTVYHPIDMRFGAVKQVPDFVTLAGQWTPVRVLFEDENGFFQSLVPFQGCGRKFGIDLPVQVVRSRSARGVILTTYAMFGFELVEELPRRPCPSFFHILQTLTDTPLRVGTGRNVEQALISFRVLHNNRSLPLHRQHHRAFALLELFHEIAGTSAEGGQRLDVLGDVQHGLPLLKHLSWC